MRGLRQRLRQGVPGHRGRHTTHTCDSFECAIHAVTPACAHCGRRIMATGVEADGRVFCCARCVKEGLDRLVDRA